MDLFKSWIVIKTPQEFEITHKTTHILSTTQVTRPNPQERKKFCAPLVQKARKISSPFFFIVFCQNRKTETHIDYSGDQQAHSWQIWHQWSIRGEDREQKQSWKFQAAGGIIICWNLSFFLRSTANRWRDYQAVISARYYLLFFVDNNFRPYKFRGCYFRKYLCHVFVW